MVRKANRHACVRGLDHTHPDTHKETPSPTRSPVSTHPHTLANSTTIDILPASSAMAPAGAGPCLLVVRGVGWGGEEEREGVGDLSGPQQSICREQRPRGIHQGHALSLLICAAFPSVRVPPEAAIILRLPPLPLRFPNSAPVWPKGMGHWG